MLTQPLTVNAGPQLRGEDRRDADAVAVLKHGTKHQRHGNHLHSNSNSNSDNTRQQLSGVDCCKHGSWTLSSASPA